MKKEDPKDEVETMLMDAQSIVCEASRIAEEYKLFKDDPTRILDLSCTIDDILAELDDRQGDEISKDENGVRIDVIRRSSKNNVEGYETNA